MAKQPPTKLTPDQVQRLQRGKAWLDRIGDAASVILSAFVEEVDDLPPMALPADFNGWNALRFQVRELSREIDKKLRTIEAEGPHRDCEPGDGR